MTINIPIQLKDQLFIKTNSEKRPIEKDWPSINNYDYDTISKFDAETYGVLCGANNLMVIDCDSKEVQDLLLTIPEIRETFIVKTATKKLYHFYFPLFEEGVSTVIPWFEFSNLHTCPKVWKVEIYEKALFDLGNKEEPFLL